MQITQVLCTEWRAHAEILDVASAAWAQRTRHAGEQARPIGDVQNGEPAHHRVECGVGQRMHERIATEMRDPLAQTAAPREIDGDLIAGWVAVPAR